jgi:hypothetical protein
MWGALTGVTWDARDGDLWTVGGDGGEGRLDWLTA